MTTSKILGIAGWSGSGKTHLLVSLIPWLKSRGLRVATLKHAHHNFDVDQPGKDSFKHRQAGAEQVLISSSKRWVLMTELHDKPEPSLQDLLERLEPCDLVLVEGFKSEVFPKIEVYRSIVGKTPLWQRREDLIAVASTDAKPDQGPALPWLNLNDLDAVGRFVMDWYGSA